MKSKIKKSTIGKVYAGAGTRGRYEGGGIMSTFRDTLQISVIGTTNNLTKTGFSTSDLNSMGGFNRSGGGVVNDGTFGGNGNGGIEKMWSGGFNINNDYGKKLKTNMMYFYYNYVKDYDKKLLTEQTLDKTLLTTLNTNVSQLRQQRHTVSSLIEWAPDTIQKIRFDVRLDLAPTGFGANGTTSTFNTQTPKLSDLLTKQSTNSTANEFNDNFMYYRKLKKPGSSLTINQNFNLKNNSSDDYNLNNLTSYTTAINSSVLDRYVNTKYSRYFGSLDGWYNTPFSKKLSYEIYLHTRFHITSNKLATYDMSPTGNYDKFLDSQSSDLVRPHFIQNVKNTLSYIINPKLTLKAAIDLEYQSYTNNFNTNIPNTNNKYIFLFPSLRLNGQKFNLNYYEFANPPDITQMQPITRQVSQLETFSGNPNLAPSHQRELSYNYYNYNSDKQSYFNLNGSTTLLTNNVIQVSTKDVNGFITSTYANKGGGWYANFGMNRGKQFKKSQTLAIQFK
ncbi:outer membrane beta-barrel protein [Mucilaginibacter sp. S1162]|uniref:Outer membrane beta-barrel protein n=1 Tax=Mucilaginibacter humi TaxID=2732510 RepID=A0ABX1W4U2_9SPHI|nr:outer membrane beta-barrel protein [Mucilaginibacter humi]NNU34025.1 outer membrane beta-barrel protein [Mucilaginibacter humi]